MNLSSSYTSRVTRLAFVLIIALMMKGCHLPIVMYKEWNPAEPMVLNTWERVGDQYWMMTPYESVAVAEFERVTGRTCDTLPLHRYGFNVWFDGNLYHVTQSK